VHLERFCSRPLASVLAGFSAIPLPRGSLISPEKNQTSASECDAGGIQACIRWSSVSDTTGFMSPPSRHPGRGASSSSSRRIAAQKKFHATLIEQTTLLASLQDAQIEGILPVVSLPLHPPATGWDASGILKPTAPLTCPLHRQRAPPTTARSTRNEAQAAPAPKANLSPAQFERHRRALAKALRSLRTRTPPLNLPETHYADGKAPPQRRACGVKSEREPATRQIFWFHASIVSSNTGDPKRETPPHPSGSRIRETHPL
jgi:hypothetical protein